VMRILIVPQIGLRNIHTDSRYLASLDLAESLIKNGHFCYMIVPEYAQSQVTRMTGLMYVYKSHEGYDFYTEVGMVDLKELADSFSRVSGKYFVDCIVTDMGAQVPIYQLTLSDIVHKSDVPCMILYPAVYEMQENRSHTRMFYALQALGNAYSVPVFLTEHQKVVSLRNARKFLAPTEVKRIEKQALMLSVGVPIEKVDTIMQGTEKFDKFTLFFGARLNHVKQPELIFDLYAKFIASGKDAQIKITTNTDELKFSTYESGSKAYDKVKDVLDITFSCPRDKYMEIASRSHVAICWSTSEGFPVGFWEQMYMGMPVLFHNEEWAVSQLPDWYPWVFKSKQEAYGMLMYIYDHYDEVSKDMERMKEYIRQNFSAGRIYSQMEQVLLRMDAEVNISCTRYSGVAGMIKQATELFEPGETITLQRMLTVLNQIGRSFPVKNKDRLSNANMPKDYELYKMMLGIGYVDTFQTPMPRLVVPDWKSWSR